MKSTQGFISTPTSKLSRWVIAMAAVISVAMTFALALCQLSRAQQKDDIHQAMIQMQARPALQLEQLRADQQLWQSTHQAVELNGQWLTDQTIFLGNRSHHGAAGFWVMTPLKINAQEAVLVKRGWVARDLRDPTLLPRLVTPTTGVVVQGRIDLPLSQWFTLGNSTSSDQGGDAKKPRIQSNIQMKDVETETKLRFVATVLQIDANSDGLRRDWPDITQTSDKNRAYAWQWFALSALIPVLYVWFQWIKPYAKK
ncbi:MAG: SURF1 family protein [Limnohabitans sp.]|nr:SURF1 family protein [Limnohabitans sp.]